MDGEDFILWGQEVILQDHVHPYLILVFKHNCLKNPVAQSNPVAHDSGSGNTKEEQIRPCVLLNTNRKSHIWPFQMGQNEGPAYVMAYNGKWLQTGLKLQRQAMIFMKMTSADPNEF